MPLGTPLGPTQTQWTASFNSVASVGGYPATFAITVTADNPDHADLPAVMQQFVDLIDASPDFTLTGAGRSYEYTQPMTPTGGA